IPSSILIIGSGVFGLSTAYSLSKDSKFKGADITVVDRWPFPTTDGASIDTSRLIRADYADPAYARLALSARAHWRGDFGAQGRYHETGVVLTSAGKDGDYVSKSLANVRDLQRLEKERGSPQATRFEPLRSREEIRAVTKVGSSSGEQGYINFTSGWADSEASMRYLRRQVESLGRVRFVTGTIKAFIKSADGNRIDGAVLSDGTKLTASLTIVAAGAWSPALVDLRGIVTATGQVLSYVELSREEQEYLSKCPTQLNMSTGLFVVPPPPPRDSEAGSSCEASRHNYLKLARHGYGYCNPTTISHPETGEKVTVSLPHTAPSAPYAAQSVPMEAIEACRIALRDFLPSDLGSLPKGAPESIPSIRDRQFAFARLCHYADTPSGDFLIDYHPRYQKSLFVATGGSGHGFKFLPVLGDQIVQCLTGQRPEDFKDKWAWPAEDTIATWKAKCVEEGGQGWPGDGSRGGRMGMVLEEEMKKGRANM
ncbi:FAD dependent oxidoreductase, partial [Rhizodiscina lignyota]